MEEDGEEVHEEHGGESEEGGQLDLEPDASPVEEQPVPGRRILINADHPEESRIAIASGNRLDEFYVDRPHEERYLGNIYLARVVNLEPSIGAAFVEFGGSRNGFLHASDVIVGVEKSRVEDLLNLAGENRRSREDPRPRRDQIKNIDELLKKGEDLIVQVTKDGIGHKGPTLTTHIAIAGRYLVLMPALNRCGVSRKIPDDKERERLKRILNSLNPPTGLGFIVRTAGIGRSKQEIQRDLEYLMRLWEAINQRIRSSRAPATIYEETDLALRTIRDLFTPDVSEILVDSEAEFRKVRDFVREVMPAYQDRVKLYQTRRPILDFYGVEGEIDSILQRKIYLPSGGSIIIDQTEALVAIDVNSGKFKEEVDLDETAFKTNLEAIPEIVRQLRLRDLGGVIVIDFIDMLDSKKRRDVEQALRDEMRKDRARVRLERMSAFGIIEMTRQRVRPSLFTAITSPCPQCHGVGHIRSPEFMTLSLLRALKGRVTREGVLEVVVRLHPKTAEHLGNRKRRELLALEQEFGKPISVIPDFDLRVDESRFQAVESEARPAGPVPAPTPILPPLRTVIPPGVRLHGHGHGHGHGQGHGHGHGRGRGHGPGGGPGGHGGRGGAHPPGGAGGAPAPAQAVTGGEQGGGRRRRRRRGKRGGRGRG